MPRRVPCLYVCKLFVLAIVVIYLYNNVGVQKAYTCNQKDVFSTRHAVMDINNSGARSNDNDASSQRLRSFLRYRNITAPLSVDVNERFRYEIWGYREQGIIPSNCAARTTTPTPPVPSQVVYANCTSPRVPNIVHLVWLYDKPQEFAFYHLLSVLSALRFVQPCAILFWYNGNAPVGKYWQYFGTNVTQRAVHMEMLKVTVPDKIWGQNIAFPQHKSDIFRFEVLKNFGGIYMDSDIIFVKSVEPLRCYDFTLGREPSNGIPTCLTFSVPHAPFLMKIIYNYKSNYSTSWAENSVRFPSRMAKEFPQLIHVEESRINRNPSWNIKEMTSFFKTCSTDWMNNYAIHLWNSAAARKRLTLPAVNETNIKTMNTAFGQVARLAYYGATGMCK